MLKRKVNRFSLKMTSLPPCYIQENQTFISLLISPSIPKTGPFKMQQTWKNPCSWWWRELSCRRLSKQFSWEWKVIHSVVKETFCLFAHRSRHAAMCEPLIGRWKFWACVKAVAHVPEGLKGRRQLWNARQENVFLTFSLGVTLLKSIATQHQHIYGPHPKY